MNVVGVLCKWCREESGKCFSIEEQKERIKDFCQKRRLNIKGFIEIDGALYDFIDKILPVIGKDVRGIVVCGRNYIGDRINDSYWIEKELVKKGGLLFILKERGDVPPKVLLKIRELIMDLGKRDMEYGIVNEIDIGIKKKENFVLKGKLPIGYRYSDQGRVIIDDKKKNMIIDIFEKYKEFGSLSQLKKYVDKKKYKTDRGKKFSRQSLWVILTNKSYIGIYERKIYKYVLSEGRRKRIVVKTEEIKGIFPPLIDKNLFDEVQQILSCKGKK